MSRAAKLEVKAAPLPSPALVPLEDALRIVPVSPSTWRRLYERGEAPRPVKVGARRLWLRAELEQFVARLLADRRSL